MTVVVGSMAVVLLFCGGTIVVMIQVNDKWYSGVDSRGMLEHWSSDDSDGK